MSSLGAALAALKVDTPPFSLRKAGQRLQLPSPISLSSVIKRAGPVPTDVSVFPEYLPSFLPSTEEVLDFPDAVPMTLHNLKLIIVPLPLIPEFPRDVNAARMRVHHILDSLGGPFARRLSTLYKRIKHREFEDARNHLNAIEETAAIGIETLLTAGDVELAQHREPVPMTIILKPEQGEGEPIEQPGVLGDYQGPEIDSGGFVLLQEFALRGPERAFRLKLWAGEIDMGLKRYPEAISFYQQARETVLPTDPRRRIANLRLAFAHLGLGDRLYQSKRVLDQQTRTDATQQYKLAISAAEKALAGPQQKAIRDYARARLEGLDAGLNFLGFSNHHLPGNPGFVSRPNEGIIGRFEQFTNAVIRLKTLREQWNRYLDAAEKSHEAQEEAQHALNEAEAEEKSAEIAEADAIDVADFQADRAEVVSTRLFLNELSEYADVLIRIVSLIGGGGGVEPRDFTDMPGFVMYPLEKVQKLKELDLQGKELALDVQLANSQREIRRLQKEVAQKNHELLKERKQFLDGKRLRTDVYYEIALEYERLLERQFDKVNRLAFFADRRAVYDLGVKGEDVPQVKFAYQRSDKDMIIDPDAFEDYEEDLGNFFSEQSKTAFDWTISLKNQYPLEYAILMETGRTFFEVSQADLDRQDEGTANKRIETVQVKVDGMAENTANVRGRLKHHGTFLLRDPKRTLEPTTTSLLPTDEEIAQAMAQAKKGEGAVIAAGGLTIWQTGEVSMNLTLEPGGEQRFRELEHYGFSGLWEFQLLPEDNPQITSINDIIVTIKGNGIIPPSPYEEKVRRLLDEFQRKEIGTERLDRAAVFSLKKKLPAAIEQLKQGAASFEITKELLAIASIASAKFKAVVCKVVLQEGNGVDLNLRISKEGSSVVIEKTTRDDGFSDDLRDIPSLPEAERFPLQGTWQVEAPNPAQLGLLDDIVCLFFYDP